MADDDDVLDWPVDTAEFMKFTVTAPIDVLADPVKVALVPSGDTRTPDHFVAAEWVPGQVWVNKDTPLLVRRFIPAETIEERRTYKAAVKVTDDPEIPIIDAGLVRGTR